MKNINIASRNPNTAASVNTSPSQFRSLLARVQSRQEEQNIRMAREIHDDVSQQLTALSIELSLLQKRLGKSANAAKVGELLQLVSGVSGSVKKIMNELRPKVLDEFGLIAAIRYECQRHGKQLPCKVSFLSASEDVDLPAFYASEVFRLFQEAFLHAVAWSSGSEIHVKINRERSQLQIELQNNGKASGIKSREQKLQALHIREHAERLGGSMESRKGRCRLTVPLKKKQVEAG